MIRSMTAFATGEAENDQGQVGWEIRSVNHRYLDITLRLPDDFRPLEGEFRQALSDRLQRGKIDASLRYRLSESQSAGQLHINMALAEQVRQLHDEVSASQNLDSEISATTLLRWPEVVEAAPPDLAALKPLSHEALQQAIDDLIDSREREGAALAATLKDRTESIEDWVAKLRQWMPEIRAGLADRLRQRVAQAMESLENQNAVDEGRLEQELVIQAQKMDVDEELDRLDAHTAEVHRILTLDEPVGRRLDFLMQEFNREANTLGSKSVDQRSTDAAVDMKVLIEQMREQVQNIE